MAFYKEEMIINGKECVIDNKHSVDYATYREKEIEYETETFSHHRIFNCFFNPDGTLNEVKPAGNIGIQKT